MERPFGRGPTTPIRGRKRSPWLFSPLTNRDDSPRHHGVTCHGFDEFDGGLEDAVMLLPLERLLLETDSPSLAAKGPKVGFQGGKVKVTNLPETKILPPTNGWLED